MKNPVQRNSPGHILANILIIMLMMVTVLTPDPGDAFIFITVAVLFTLQAHYRPSANWYGASAIMWTTEALHQWWPLTTLASVLMLTAVCIDLGITGGRNNGQGNGQAEPNQESVKKDSPP